MDHRGKGLNQRCGMDQGKISDSADSGVYGERREQSMVGEEKILK